MKFQSTLAVTALLATAALGINTTAAFADSGADALSTIQRTAPEALSGHVSVSELDAPTSAGLGVLVTVASTAAQGVTIHRAHVPQITVGLPTGPTAPARKSRGGLVSFDNRDGSTTVPSSKSDGSVQILTTITRSQAPSRS